MFETLQPLTSKKAFVPPEVSATRLTFPFGGTTGSREDGDELRRTSRAFWMQTLVFHGFFPDVFRYFLGCFSYKILRVFHVLRLVHG